MIRVLVVDDSLTSRKLLRAVLETAPDLQVCGEAGNGLEATHAVLALRPDVIVMDINMPVMDGYEATMRILEGTSVPIVICSGAWGAGEAVNSLKALEAGAVTALAKPQGPGAADFAETSAKFVRTVRAMSEVRVVRRRYRKSPTPPSSPWTHFAAGNGLGRLDPNASRLPGLEMVAIGVSTGGPPVLKLILSGLAKPVPVPIVIVQHISQGFLPSMTAWLANEVGMPVRILSAGEQLLPGTVYFAPDHHHLGICGGIARLDTTTPAENSLRPSISYLFRSLAAGYGARAVGILLTGMGTDGAAALKQMREAGALTVVQDRESAVVYGMPGEAVKLGAAQYVLTPEEISQALNSLFSTTG